MAESRSIPSTQQSHNQHYSIREPQNQSSSSVTSSSPPSSTDTTPSQTPYQELSQSVFEIPTASASSPTQSRGRPRQKRRQPSKRYFTPPSRLPSPVRQDFVLEVETMPQEPDIFADPETDYFSSAEKPEAPRAFRRHFFDAMPAIDGQASNGHMVSQSIDGRLAGK